MPAPKKPTDHQSKALAQPGEFSVVKGEFRFVGKDGQTYTLPAAADGMESMEFGEFLDLVDGPQSEAILALKLLKAIDLDDATRSAVRSLSIIKGAELLGAWLKATGPNGVSVPQS